ncbi:MAG: GNAT family N-acetyltransferase [Polyangiales bacterium]
MTHNPLDSVLQPRSIAVVGASDREGSVGGVLLRNLREAGFPGELFAVNDKRKRVQGMRSHQSVLALGRSLDLALVAVPAAGVPQVIRDCGQAGVKAVVLLSAGFAEQGAAGASLQAEVLEIARSHGVRVLGPNCLGVLRPSAKLRAIFGKTPTRAGRLALVSQSGAVCTAILDWAEAREIGFSAVLSLGGAADVGFGEVLDYLALDAETDAILLYLEGVDHPRRFMSGLRVAARMKPVIALKAGRKPAGARAAATHSGALVGDDAVFASALRRAGAVRAESFEQLFSAAEMLASGRRATGNRLGIVTNAGGLGVMAADRAADLDLPLAALRPDTLAVLDAALPPQWSHANPVDLVGDAPPERYARAMAAVLDDPEVDGVITLLSPQAMTDPTAAASAVIAASQRSDKPVLSCFSGGAQVVEAQTLFAKHRLPHLPTPEHAIEAFADLWSFEHNQRLLLQVPGPLADPRPPDVEAARSVVLAALGEGREQLRLDEAKAVLRAFHVEVTASLPARSADEAAAAAERLGLPVAMKIDSDDLSHKSDVGGVRLGIDTLDGVRTAFTQMLAEARQRAPAAKLRGVTLEPMLAKRFGRELIVGVTRDPALGPAIGFGAGGTLVELIADHAVALPPLNRLLARDLLERTRVRTLLGPFRGMPAADLDALENVLLRVSDLVCELPEVHELDINPLIADEHGAVAVDARVRLRTQAAGLERYAHMAIEPFPAHLACTQRLVDGSQVTLRPIRPEDAQIEQSFVRELSSESRYFRFHQGLVELTPRMLARFTQIDYDREMAFVAVSTRDGGEHEIGVARYVSNPDGESCEFALVVADAWQHKGLGSSLMAALIDVARAKGLSRMEGEVLTENTKMLGLMRELGFSVRPDPHDATLRVVELALRPKDTPAR